MVKRPKNLFLQHVEIMGKYYCTDLPTAGKSSPAWKRRLFNNARYCTEIPVQNVTC